MQTISVLSRVNNIYISERSANAALVAGFAVMMALGAYIRIPLPFTPVPVTLQTFFALLSAAFLGRRMGSYAQGLYILFGVSGLPVFQGYGAGLAHIIGPTGGYIMGFFACQAVTGSLLARAGYKRGFLRVLFSMGLGLLTIYAFGMAWLMAGYGFSLPGAFMAGVLPFIPAAAGKLSLAALIFHNFGKR